jgi:hypothetical protein
MKILIKKRGNLMFPLKFDLKFKISAFLLLFILLNISATNCARNTKITLDLENVTLEKVLYEIESVTGLPKK